MLLPPIRSGLLTCTNGHLAFESRVTLRDTRNTTYGIYALYIIYI